MIEDFQNLRFLSYVDVLSTSRRGLAKFSLSTSKRGLAYCSTRRTLHVGQKTFCRMSASDEDVMIMSAPVLGDDTSFGYQSVKAGGHQQVLLGLGDKVRFFLKNLTLSPRPRTCWCQAERPVEGSTGRSA